MLRPPTPPCSCLSHDPCPSPAPPSPCHQDLCLAAQPTPSLIPSPNPGDRTPLHLQTSSRSGSQVQGLPFPILLGFSAHFPTPVLSGFSQPHSFPKHQPSLIHSPNTNPLPCHQGLPSLSQSHWQPSVQVPSPGVPEGAPWHLTPRRDPCCSGIHLPPQAGRSRRAVPGVNTPHHHHCLLEPEDYRGHSIKVCWVNDESRFPHLASTCVV